MSTATPRSRRAIARQRPEIPPPTIRTFSIEAINSSHVIFLFSRPTKFSKVFKFEPKSVIVESSKSGLSPTHRQERHCVATTNALEENGTPAKRRRKTSASQDNTRDKILDAAEELFGERTFDTVSLRDITQHAKVTLALASYHFGTKDRLFADIVARRADVLGQMRRERLAKLEGSSKLTTESILDAFMRPM